MATFVKFAVYKPMGFPLKIHYIDTAGNPIIGADGQPMIKLLDLAKTAGTEPDGFIDLRNVLYAQAIDGYEFTSNINTNNAEESKTLVGAETGEIGGAPENRKATIGSYTGYQLRFIKYDNGTFYAAMGNRTGNNRFAITGKPAVYLTYKELPVEFTSQDFTYTGAVQEFTVPKTANYKIEVWGAQGGGNSSYAGGKGGYSYANITLAKGKVIYISVGGTGGIGNYNIRGTSQSTCKIGEGGWNGGGNAGMPSYHTDERVAAAGGGGGGGASSVQTSLLNDGQLSNYENVKDTDVLIVAGGGGGCVLVSGLTAGYGGGESGQTTKSYNSSYTAEGGTQTLGFAFGKGQEGQQNGRGWYAWGAEGNGGGGGGWYGGFTVTTEAAYSRCCGAGGSGHIGSMVTDGQTIAGNQSITEPNGSTATGHSGNGYARITLVT